MTATNWDDLSLAMEYNSGPSNSQNPSLRLPLVKGSPYISAEVPLPAQPIIRAPGNGGGVINSVTPVASNKLKIVVGSVPGGEGTHTFLLWASSAISHTLTAGSIRIQGGAAGGKFSGFLRLSWVPNAGAAGAAAIESMLDKYVDVVPVGGSVNAWSNLAAGTASYSLTWTTRSMTGAAVAPSNLLMLALHHHIDTIIAPASAPAFPLGVGAADSTGQLSGSAVYTSQPPQGSGRSSNAYGTYIMTVRGPQVPVVGACWVLQEQTVPLMTETQAAANLKNPAWRAEIEKSLLVSDKDNSLARVLFFHGVAKLAASKTLAAVFFLLLLLHAQRIASAQCLFAC